MKPAAADDAGKKEELDQLTEEFGTKMAYLIFYLRYLFIDSPHSRVIVFSQVSLRYLFIDSQQSRHLSSGEFDILFIDSQ